MDTDSFVCSKPTRAYPRSYQYKTSFKNRTKSGGGGGNLHSLQPLRKRVDCDLLSSNPLVSSHGNRSVIFCLFFFRALKFHTFSSCFPFTCMTLRSAIVIASRPNTSHVLVRPPIFGALSNNEAQTTMGNLRLLESTSSRESDSSSFSMCQGIILEQNQFVQKEKPFKTPSPWFESLSRLLPPEDPWSILWRHIFFF